MKKALELSKIPIERIREKLIAKGSSGDLEHFKKLIEEEIARRREKKKPNEKWEILPELREFAKSHETIRIFKNRIGLRDESPEALRRQLSELIVLSNATMVMTNEGSIVAVL